MQRMPEAQALLQCQKCLSCRKAHPQLNPAFLLLRGITDSFPLGNSCSFFTVNAHSICINGQEVTNSTAQSDILILCRQRVCAPVFTASSERFSCQPRHTATADRRFSTRGFDARCAWCRSYHVCWCNYVNILRCNTDYQ